jgi:hypothetical protein
MEDDVLGEGKQRVLSMSYRVLFFFLIFNAEGSSLCLAAYMLGGSMLQALRYGSERHGKRLETARVVTRLCVYIGRIFLSFFSFSFFFFKKKQIFGLSYFYIFLTMG